MKVFKFIKKSVSRHKYLSLIIGVMIIGTGIVATLNSMPVKTTSYSKPKDAFSSYGSSESSSNSPSTSSSSESTNPAPSGNPAQSAQQQQANNEAEDQSLMDQNNNTNSTSSPSTTSPVNTTLPNCTAYGTKIGALDQQKATVEDQLANVDQTAEAEGGGYGVTSSGLQNLENQLTSQYDSELSSIQSQINSLNAEYPDCQ